MISVGTLLGGGTKAPRIEIRRERADWQRSLARHLEWMDITDGVIPLTDGRVTVGLLLYPFAADSLTTRQQNDSYLAVRNALARFPERTHFQFWYSHMYATEAEIRAQMGHEETTGNRFVDGLVDRRSAFLERLARHGYLFEPRSYLFATFAPSPEWELDNAEARLRPTKRFSFAKIPAGHALRQRHQAEHERMLADVGAQIDLIRAALRAAGVRSRRLTDDETATLLFRSLNPRWRSTLHRPLGRQHAESGSELGYYKRNPYARPPSPREQLVYSDVVKREDRLDVDGVMTRSLYLKKLPEFAVPGMIEAITSGLHFEFTLTVNVDVQDRATELAKIRQRKKWHDSIRNAWLGTVKLDTAESELIAQQLEALIYDTIEHKDRPLNAGLILTFEAEDSTDLKRKTNQVITQLSTMHSAEPFHDRHRSFETWISSLPAHGHSDERMRETTQGCAAAMVPIYGRYRGTTGWPTETSTAWPLIVAPNDRGEIVSIDPFQLRSRHTAIWGTTGSGKTVFSLEMLVRHLRRPDAMAIVFDATGTAYSTDAGIGESAGSYERITKATGGEYVPVGLEMPNFNPFALRLPDHEIDGHQCDQNGVPHFAYLQCLNFLEALIIDDDRTSLDKPTQGVLLRVLKSLMRRRPDVDDPPRMDQFLKELAGFAMTDERARSCLHALTVYSPDTPLGNYLSRRDRVFQTSNRFTVFDLRNVKEFGRDARAVVLLLTNYAATEMQKRSNRERRKMIVGDELHDWVEGPMGVAFGRYAATLRKQNGIVVYISQDLSDVTSTSIGARLLANTPIKVFFDLNDRLDAYRNQYGLSEADASLIASLGGSGGGSENTATRSAFLKIGHHRTRLSLPMDPTTYYLTTSHGDDVQLMRAAQAVLGVPGRDIDYLDFFDRIARAYPPGWTDRNDVRAEAARLVRRARKRGHS